jgi:hypothetical protein
LFLTFFRLYCLLSFSPSFLSSVYFYLQAQFILFKTEKHKFCCNRLKNI